jgi:hypothetical protein
MGCVDEDLDYREGEITLAMSDVTPEATALAKLDRLPNLGERKRELPHAGFGCPRSPVS